MYERCHVIEVQWALRGRQRGQCRWTSQLREDIAFVNGEVEIDLEEGKESTHESANDLLPDAGHRCSAHSTSLASV